MSRLGRDLGKGVCSFLLYRFVAAGLLLALTQMPVWSVAPQSTQPPARAIGPINVPPSPKPPFFVRSYQAAPQNGQDALPLQGKCLDYGTPPLPGGTARPFTIIGRIVTVLRRLLASTGGSPPPAPSVFLNDCAAAHPIVVEELVDRNHEVILHAGNQIIGIPRHLENGAPQLPAAPLRLTLFTQREADSVLANDVFALDGDSIILESSRPCFNTDSALCPASPPQLVIQVENAGGANGTPLVLGPRNLADSEFWDFIASDGSHADPTLGFMHVSTAAGLWNAICAKPQASEMTGLVPISDPGQPDDGEPPPCAQLNPGWGIVIEITSQTECNNVSGDVSNIGFCIDLSGFAPLILPAGITLRGDRRGTRSEPSLYAAYFKEKSYFPESGEVTVAPYDPTAAIENCSTCMIQVHGDYVRITQLRLKGQSRSRDDVQVSTTAISVDSPAAASCDFTSPFPRPCYYTTTEFIASIDHNEISDWEEAAVAVNGGFQFEASRLLQVQDYFDKLEAFCQYMVNDPRTQNNVRIQRNFIHHNERWSGGYGSVMSGGGRALIEGNTFLMHRHAIAADGDPHGEYHAWYNLVLEDVPVYSIFKGGAQQNFDMHGTHAGGYGGLAGNRVDIAGNTFLQGTDPDLSRWDFELRGHPCYVPYFRDNVTERNNSDHAINLHKVDDPAETVINQGPNVPSTPVTPLPYVREPVNGAFGPLYYSVMETNNKYADSSPAFFFDESKIRVGDFDGDGVQDLFFASGTAWYYSPGGTTEWRFLSAKTDTTDTLLFGDFDGDGRTDVVTLKGHYLMVSWGGISDWQVLNPNYLFTLPAITDLAVGNFVDDFAGDKRDDIFWANGKIWQISSGGSGPFKFAQASGLHVNELRFGDFRGNGHTDVFSVQSTGWEVSFSDGTLPLSGWTPLPVSLTTKIDGLTVADFEGNGTAGIAMLSDTLDGWRFWHQGLEAWVYHRVTGSDACQGFTDSPLLVGHFDASRNSGADILVWTASLRGRDPIQFCISKAGLGDLQLWSGQDVEMR